jgi:hypothetical protein
MPRIVVCHRLDRERGRGSRGHGAEDSGAETDYVCTSGCESVPGECALGTSGQVELKTTRKGPSISWQAKGFPVGEIDRKGAVRRRWWKRFERARRNPRVKRAKSGSEFGAMNKGDFGDWVCQRINYDGEFLMI